MPVCSGYSSLTVVHRVIELVSACMLLSKSGIVATIDIHAACQHCGGFFHRACIADLA